MSHIANVAKSVKNCYPSLKVFSGAATICMARRGRKLCKTLEEAITKCGLRDGMTISFHHAYREGDVIINSAIDIISKMGFRNLTLASSSLLSCHSSLIKYIESGVITQIYTSGLRGKLAQAICSGLMDKPIHIHSHGGRVKLIQSGEINIDIAFLAVSSSDEFGNANAVAGQSQCGSLGYAMVDAQYAHSVVLLTQSLVGYPNFPASIRQDQTDYIVQVEQVGDSTKISAGATRVTTNARDLMIARSTADVIASSGYFKDGFSIQLGSGAVSMAVMRFLERKMEKSSIKADFALGGISRSVVELHEKGLIRTLLDTQSFDMTAVKSLNKNAGHHEVSANFYANPDSKGASCEQLDIVILSALEIDLEFNVNVLTGSDGIICGASGGHCDVAETAQLTIVVAPLIRSRMPTVVKKVTTVVTPGESVDILVTDHGIAVNSKRPEIAQRLTQADLPVMSIATLYERAISITGIPDKPILTDRIIAVVRYRDGSVIDLVKQVK